MENQYWQIEGKQLVWNVEEGQCHFDDLEMSGLYSDYIVSYGVKEDGSLHIAKSCYFPTLRTIPNNTHATFSVQVNCEKESDCPWLLYNGAPVTEYPKRFVLDGTLKVYSDTEIGLSVQRCFYPAFDSRNCMELVTLKADKDMKLTLSKPSSYVYAYGRGTKGVYIARISHSAPEVIKLSKGESFTYAISCSADIANEEYKMPDAKKELCKRMERVKELCDDSLILDSGNDDLDTMVRFAKLRAGESIFETLSGKFHSPGGRAYYAATWCNDQIEYAGPHFAMTGDETAIEASLNAYRSYIPFMSDAYFKLPCSIIAEGLDIWEGAGDRGDAAMYLYGASLFCLYLADKKVANELYPAICWCAEYCQRQRSKEGVICSNTDELEGRFPTDGYANLSTSSLCYGGLLFAAKLSDSLGYTEKANLYRERAKELRIAMESYFGAELHEYKTYRYSKGIDTLRAWICLPLCMGINERAEGTLAAMLSPYLWTTEGMLTCERLGENDSDTIWDRSTLYGMKAAFLVGGADKMTEPLLRYCHKRLLCDRVPYAVEAYPEGGKRHLSGESALFVRMMTEGIFGIQPESLDSFSFIAHLPKEFPHLYLEKIKICGGSYDIKIEEDHFFVSCNGKEIAEGKTEGQRVVIRKIEE